MSPSYTAEQEFYIINPKKSNTRLIACAGSGKTKCIIQRCIFLIKENIFSQISVLILTFSHFTQNDFVRRLSQDDVEGIILRDNVKTIDAYAKYILESLSDKNDKKTIYFRYTL